MAFAQYFIGPRASGTGEAFRANIAPLEQIFLNPAILPFAQGLSTAWFYNKGNLGSGLKEKSTHGFAIVDNSKGVVFPGAFSYLRRLQHFINSPDVKEDYAQLSLGGGLFRRLTMGGSLIWLQHEEAGQKAVVQWNGTLGWMWIPFENWAFSFVFSHFLKADEEKVPAHLQLIPQWALAGNYMFSHFFKLLFDVTRKVHGENQNFGYHLGFESYIHPLWVVRSGISWEGAERLIGMGLSFDGPRLKLDYSYTLKPQTDQSLHSVGARLSF
ncbi:MAG: hypothetical protein D6797_05420 [Bdellovibrio sp.]|nr:MAG: hypothetical protein D6797_05420 [Bdellovibrio sp.]